MNEIFDFSKSSTYELQYVSNCLSRSNIDSTHFGIESVAKIAAKTCYEIPNKIKEASSRTVFKIRIKKWVPQGCPCRHVGQVGFDGNPSVTFS